MTVAEYQQGQSYKYVLSDPDEDYYMGTDYLTPATAKDVENVIKYVVSIGAGMETLHDVYLQLKSFFLGSLFYERETIAPQLTDGVILLASKDGI